MESLETLVVSFEIVKKLKLTTAIVINKIHKRTFLITLFTLYDFVLFTSEIVITNLSFFFFFYNPLKTFLPLQMTQKPNNNHS